MSNEIALKEKKERLWADFALDTLGRKEPSGAERRKAEAYCGARRLAIELEFEPTGKRESYVKKYLELVDSFAGILKGEGGMAGCDFGTGKNIFGLIPMEEKKKLQEDLISAIWGVLYGNLNVTYGGSRSGFLRDSLDTGSWDCDNSSTLVFDVAREVGVPVEMVIVPGHALVKTNDFFFETTSKGNPVYYPADRLYTRYPVIYAITSELEVVDAVAYSNRGTAYFNEAGYDMAIKDFDRAIGLLPKYADAYKNRSLAYFFRGEYEKARQDEEKAKEILRLMKE
ncbi:MAG: hypothetical protein Sv326_0623 [Candidatus Fermentimicrarchaeum limneticum]|uniref:Uncharacterized protein n=1 Tax=Fermentimicrarchaeum limneticum TaxID=2795018 RepID=A0A7D6BLX3_FERL1|nr:MAG: hypothetical protein Sv326_0623 [Candidatus Fermentimicrarchaeum limneticum]